MAGRRNVSDNTRAGRMMSSEHSVPKGRTLYAIYVDGFRYDMSRGRVYIGIVGGCYTDRDRAMRDAWDILDESWDDLVEGRPDDPLGRYPVSVVEIFEDRARSPEAYDHDPEWYEGEWTDLRYGDEPWNDSAQTSAMYSEKGARRIPSLFGKVLSKKSKGSRR